MASPHGAAVRLITPAQDSAMEEAANAVRATIVDSSGTAVTSFVGTEYTEGDTDATITGTAVLWEDTGDTLRTVSAAKPLPIGDAGGSLTVDGTVAATQSGTWTVQPGNTANTTPWLASIHDGTTKASVRDLTSSNPLDVAITDGSGNQITSFGGGTQYTEADTDASITGTAVMWEDTSDTLRAVSAAKPLPVNVVSGSAAGTEYVEDAAAPADPQGGALMLVYDAGGDDTVSTDGDWIAARCNENGVLYVTQKAGGSFDVSNFDPNGLTVQAFNCYNSSDTYTVAGNGTPVDLGGNVYGRMWQISVVGTGAAASAWSVDLQVSPDGGTTWSTIATHTDTDGNGNYVVVPGPGPLSANWRTKCNSVTLGGASNITAYVQTARF